jgi:molybdenum cofactor cytidylyltransferase
LICDEIIIITGHNSNLIEEHTSKWEPQLHRKIKLIYNSNYKKGMFTSLKLGVENCNTNWLLYHFVDQPNLHKEFYYNFTKQINDDYDWIQPKQKDIKGHPILFNKKVMRKIITSKDSISLKNISSESDIKKKYWKCNYKEILLDFDTPKDLEKLEDKKM